MIAWADEPEAFFEAFRFDGEGFVRFKGNLVLGILKALFPDVTSNLDSKKTRPPLRLLIQPNVRDFILSGTPTTSNPNMVK